MANPVDKNIKLVECETQAKYFDKGFRGKLVISTDNVLQFSEKAFCLNRDREN